MTEEILETEVLKEKPKLKKRKNKVALSSFRNYQIKQCEIELEHKLPNEFKGSIRNYNHRNDDRLFHIDDNVYNCFN
jgi:hypothetical protein